MRKEPGPPAEVDPVVIKHGQACSRDDGRTNLPAVSSLKLKAARVGSQLSSTCRATGVGWRSSGTTA